ncbi:MAG: PDZ domain-containing protein, partial [Muribaculaceae bacterium]|nr:PDZ domain-containing protein [Muribaculaceae bacterium]
SGGALVNTRGELVGINTAIYSETGSYVGYSFAIPTAIVSKVVSDLKEYGTVQRAVLGISTRELTPQLAKEKGITAVNDGCYVAEVNDRSAAMEAGLKSGDVLTAINGAPVHNFAQLQGEMSKYSPGDRIKLEYVRDNKKHTTDVTFRNSQGSTEITKAQDFSALGCALKEISAEKAREMQIGGGVEVNGLTSGKFRDAGIKEGFVILDINNNRVRTADDVEAIYNAIMKGGDSDKVMFITGLYPTGRKVYYAVDLN